MVTAFALPFPDLSPPAQPGLHIELLGPPRVAWEGRPLALTRRQSRALLYRLASSRQPAPRDQLCFLFWPDLPEAEARRNLAVLLHHLRRALPLPSALLSDGDTITLDPDSIQSDVLLASEALDAGLREGRLDALVAATELYRGPFLDGFSLPGAGEFEAWAERERQAWQRRYLEALVAVIDGHEASGDTRAAIAAAHRYLATDELAEEMHRRLIALYAAAGDRTAALRQFEQCAAVLERELGAQPHPETVALYGAVRDGRLPAVRAAKRGAVRLVATPVPEAPPLSGPSLPLPPAPLLGRAEELAAAQALLAREDVRLLTLCGPGGSGKTRLALQIAHEVRARFAAGAVFVPLASVRDAGQVAGAIARACGLHESGKATPEEMLSAYLRDKHLLLVLDNCEHVLSAMPLLAHLLAAAPGLRVLATSRVLLNLAGEHALPVPPLPLPNLNHLPPLPELADQPAVALLVARARAADPSFRLTEGNAEDLAAICVRVDGLPLAIELAAARLRLLSPSLLRGRLDRRLALLSGGPRDLPERHQALRATIEWSERLLDAEARTLFARLSVFTGGWTLEAAEAVCGESNVLDSLHALLDAHLLTRADAADGEPRFSMLETVREYALERLTASGEAPATERAHACYFTELAERGAGGMRGPAAGAWLRRLDAEHANLTAAVSWAIARQESAIALRLSGSLGRYWFTRGHLAEGRRMLEAALALPHPMHDGGPSEEIGAYRARAHETVAELAKVRGDGAAAHAHMHACVALWRALGRERELALSLFVLSGTAWLAGDREAADAAFAEGKALAEALGDPAALARAALCLGRADRHAAHFASARGWLEASLAFERRRGDPLALTEQLLDLAPVMLALDDAASARAYAREALALGRELGLRAATAQALNELGEIARHQGDSRTACARYTASLRLLREMGNRSDVPRLLHNIAYIALQEGERARATDLFRESLHGFQAGGMDRGIAEALSGLACVAAVDGQPLRAARLWGVAEALREAGGGWGMWPPDQREHDRYLAQARAAAEPDAFTAAWHEGRALPLDRALAELAVQSP